MCSKRAGERCRRNSSETASPSASSICHTAAFELPSARKSLSLRCPRWPRRSQLHGTRRENRKQKESEASLRAPPWERSIGTMDCRADLLLSFLERLYKILPLVPVNLIARNLISVLPLWVLMRLDLLELEIQFLDNAPRRCIAL